MVSAVTDLASLRYWAHPGVDLHLLIHPESAAEVRAIAGPATRVQAVYGFSDPAFRHPPHPGAARRAIGLPEPGRLVVVSGGGWAVGDLGAAVDEALRGGARVLVLTGRNEGARTRLAARYAGREDVAVWGFTEQMPAVLAAADVLVHSTAGLTVLEALMSGCRPISFGWARPHPGQQPRLSALRAGRRRRDARRVARGADPRADGAAAGAMGARSARGGRPRPRRGRSLRVTDAPTAAEPASTVVAASVTQRPSTTSQTRSQRSPATSGASTTGIATWPASTAGPTAATVARWSAAASLASAVTPAAAASAVHASATASSGEIEPDTSLMASAARASA